MANQSPEHSSLLSDGRQDPYISQLLDNDPPSAVRYLGPRHSYSDAISGILFGSEEDRDSRPINFHPMKEFQSVFEALQYDESQSRTLAVVPLENVPSGHVPDVVNALLTGDYLLVEEATLMVRIMLAGTGHFIDDVRTVYSQAQPFQQASRLMQELRFKRKVVSSTSAAAERVADYDIDSAAFCSEAAARENKLHIIRKDVQNHPKNRTRFVVIESAKSRPRPHVDSLAKGGPLDTHDTGRPVRAAAIITPEAARKGYRLFKALGHIADNNLVPAVLGYRYEHDESGDELEKYYVELTGSSPDLYRMLSKPPEEMNLQLLGIFATGATYQETN